MPKEVEYGCRRWYYRNGFVHPYYKLLLDSFTNISDTTINNFRENMGVKSTQTVTRQSALQAIKDKLDNCSNEALEGILETVAEENGDRFSNFIVNDRFEVSITEFRLGFRQ